MSTSPPAPCILLCTLGASWAVIPEIYGWLAPEVLDLVRPAFVHAFLPSASSSTPTNGSFIS
ncbi:MAG: hypothetical protein Q4A97_03685 [Comamonadaceae bacterium]|nr:hypothetical protein [Comamonadaceae bacterium]